MSESNLKVCTLCKIPKQLTAFNKKKSSKDGLRNVCRDCNQSKSRAYYASNKEKHKTETIKRKKKVVEQNKQYILFLLKDGCVDCPEKDPRCLEFDHKRDKKANISTMLQHGCSLKTLLKEIDKCEIRCANCHRKKTAKDQGWYKHIFGTVV